MAKKIGSCIYVIAILVVAATRVSCDDSKGIPADASQLNPWYKANVLPLSKRKGTLDPVLEAAESNRKVIKVRQDGSGDFKTVTDAINSIPTGNKARVVVNIGPGTYNEKILIPKTKPFVTLRGSRTAGKPTLQYAGTAKKYGTFESGTLIVMSDYFVAVNLIIKNTSPRPNADQAKAGAQAVALRLAGDKAAIYSSKIYGYQDTLLDETGRHFFKACYIEGTVDFIFGSGKSLYLQAQIHVIKEKWRTVITAQAKQEKNEDSGFSFVHCNITGDGVDATYLGRTWQEMPEVVFSYTSMSKTILPIGWDNSQHPNGQMYFGEYQNTGAGANPKGRAKYSQQLSTAGARRFLNLGYIQASKWLLPASSSA